MQVISRSLTFMQLSIRQRILKLFRISYIRHIYRVYIKANAVSLSYKYSFTRDLLRRYQDYRDTKKRYRGLQNIIRLKTKTKKILHAWKSKNYSLFLELNLLFIFAWPIWVIKKCTNIYFLLKPLVIDFFEWSKKIMKLRTVNKK